LIKKRKEKCNDSFQDILNYEIPPLKNWVRDFISKREMKCTKITEVEKIKNV
jgi:hypothetical protein